ncbi:MAG: sterol desaturase family protein [Flavobacteriaceae bacterium]|nr:sterol desaturase family protein [Eudoraea sp.]NNJ38744.1 sterol desaturase family protein [Flavobacteriaceae bacterium]
METINQLLSINPSYILIGLLIIFFSMEMAFNRPVNFKGKLNHMLQSFLFQLIAILIGSLLGLMIVTTFEFINENNFGLFNWIEVPFALKVIVGVFIIDFSDYWFHRFDHKVPLFWRFHRVHHSDTAMDASTALRQYPTELIYFSIGELFLCVVFGLDILSMNIFLFLIIPVFYLQHTNMRYPESLDKALGWLFLMPNYHKVHHEQDQFYTDSNYGTLFVIWDRLFGTFRTKPVAEINYGLKEFKGKKKQSFLYLIISPFINIK